MQKNVLIILASAREDGNTHALCKAFQKGAEEAGHSVTFVNVADKSISGCRGCKNCWKGGRFCAQQDDMDEVYPLYQKADVLVLASPIYFSGPTGQFKCFLDRTHPNESAPEASRSRVKETALLLTAGSPPDADAFDAAVKIYADLVKYQELHDLGIIRAGGTEEKGAIMDTPFLKEAFEMGRAL